MYPLVDMLLSDPKMEKQSEQPGAQSVTQSIKGVGKQVCFPVRYADDFIILVHAPDGPGQMERAVELAEREKTELAKLLKEGMGLELSESKTKITPVTSPMSFLGFTIRVQYNPKSRWISKVVIPKSKSHKIRQAIKDIFSVCP